MLAVVLFADKSDKKKLFGLFKGGSLELLGVQLVAVVSIGLWTIVGTYLGLCMNSI